VRSASLFHDEVASCRVWRALGSRSWWVKTREVSRYLTRRLMRCALSWCSASRHRCDLWNSWPRPTRSFAQPTRTLGREVLVLVDRRTGGALEGTRLDTINCQPARRGVHWCDGQLVYCGCSLPGQNVHPASFVSRDVEQVDLASCACGTRGEITWSRNLASNQVSADGAHCPRQQRHCCAARLTAGEVPNAFAADSTRPG